MFPLTSAHYNFKSLHENMSTIYILLHLCHQNLWQLASEKVQRVPIFGQLWQGRLIRHTGMPYEKMHCWTIWLENDIYVVFFICTLVFCLHLITYIDLSDWGRCKGWTRRCPKKRSCLSDIACKESLNEWNIFYHYKKIL